MAGLAVRVIYAVAVPGRFNDTEHYLDDVALVLAGRWDAIDWYFFQGYFLPVAPLAALGMSAYAAATIVCFLCALVSGAAIFLLARRLAGPRAGVWAPAAYALHPMAAAYAAGSTMETLYGAFFLAGLWLVVSADRPRNLARGLAGGVCFGLAGLQRNEGLIFAGALLVGVFALDRWQARAQTPPRRWPALGMAALGIALVLVAWMAVFQPRIRGPILFGKTSVNVAVSSPEDKEQWARQRAGVASGVLPPRPSLAARVGTNARLYPAAMAKMFASPLLVLLPLLAIGWGVARARREEAMLLLALTGLATFAYLGTAMEYRYLFLGALLSMPLAGAAADAAWRSRGTLVRGALVALLPVLLAGGFAVRRWRDEPRGKSSIGAAALLAREVPPQALIYFAFDRPPEGLGETLRAHAWEHAALPYVPREEAASLIPASRDLAFVFVDAYHLDAFYRDGLFFLSTAPIDVPGARLEPLGRTTASARNPGVLVRLSRR
ncbi:MAG: glycosyltransferase family 39 protein [Deltaproteobacteria bacterium]|nr:glycosyltransferase family 39 protein [Deltaproteobacteria bacterium]